MMDLGWLGPYRSTSTFITTEIVYTHCVQKDCLRDPRILFVRHAFPRAHSTGSGAQARQKSARCCSRFRLGEPIQGA
jgi:hypothetical protein